MKLPKWAVVYNIKESDDWVGTVREFFNSEKLAISCYNKQIRDGNYPTKRAFHYGTDFKHLGAVHRLIECNGGE